MKHNYSKGRLGNRHRAEVLETLVELYLRLNGYFCIRNYLQHRARGFGLETESDLLAIRMAHQEEPLPNGGRQQNDETLVLSANQGLVDYIITEVKEPSVEFNKTMCGSNGQKFVVMALRMLGVFPPDAFNKNGVAYALANDLHRQINQERWLEIPNSRNAEYGTNVRMAVFAPDTAKHAEARKHFDLQHVLNFIKDRMRPGVPCADYLDRRHPDVSPWRGCTRLIVTALKSNSGDQQELKLEDFLETVISCWSELGR